MGLDAAAGFGALAERPRPESQGYILSAFSDDASTWRKHEGVRIDSGGEGALDCVWGPDVVPIGDGRYRMYFEGRTRTGDREVKSVIASAVSSDGIAWQQEPGIRLAAADTSYGAPRALHIESSAAHGRTRIRLFASASPYRRDPEAFHGDGDDDGHTGYSDRNVVSAVSDDGLTFGMEPGIRVAQDRPLEAYSLYAPEIVRLGDGTYRMYYAAWVSAPDVPAGSPYHGRILSAVSADGLRWVKDPGTCIDNGGKWDRAKASGPCIIDLPDSRFRMFYEACDCEGRWRIASAISLQRPTR
jgi:hypothetical protein